MKIRPAQLSDQAFIRATAFKSMWQLWAKPNEVSMELFKLGFDRLFETGELACWIVSPDDYPNQICGYALMTGHALRWVYVRAVYRQLGLASSLLQAHTPTVYTYKAKGLAQAQLMKKFDVQFYPFEVPR